MASGPPAAAPHKPACSICARRKVKCDKKDPCSNCLKSKSQCVYEAPALHRRQRKRAADEDLLNRLAVYEDLMQRHNVDFSPYAQTWIPSSLEAPVEQNDAQKFIPLTPVTATPGEKVAVQQATPSDMEPCLWTNLCPELKHPPIQGPCHSDDPLLLPMPSLHSLLSTSDIELSTLHPEPRLIFRFWQIFVENVNPLFKIIHVPTTQQRILDASWNPSSAPKPLTATMFAIYTLSVTSMSANECLTTVGESRESLLTRYRTATYRALFEADFLTTRDFEVLQALVLFLFASAESELTSTLAAAAIKLGRKIGLHHARPDPKLSFFEREMRIRLWWQLYALETRTRTLVAPEMKAPPSKGEFGDVRPPLNVNDADLHPDMVEAPVEHEGLTEMMCVLVKCEVFVWFRSSALSVIFMENMSKPGARDGKTRDSERNMIAELEAIYERKYFRFMDRRIPLHDQTYAMARLALTLMQFKTHHPRGKAAGRDGEILLSKEEGEMLFDLAVRWMELVEVGFYSQFSSHIFTHMTSKCHNDAVVYVISDLRRRCSGERVDQAWGLVGRFFEDHGELYEDGKSAFNDVLGDLTLEAWEARKKALAVGKSIQEDVEAPRFINRLWEKSRRRVEGDAQRPGVESFQDLAEVGLTADGNLDWDYWNKFLSF